MRIPAYGNGGIKLPLSLAFVGLQDAHNICRGCPPSVIVQVLADGVDNESGVEHVYCTKCFCITRILSNMISWLVKYKTRNIIIPVFEAIVCMMVQMARIYIFVTYWTGEPLC